MSKYSLRQFKHTFLSSCQIVKKKEKRLRETESHIQDKDASGGMNALQRKKVQEQRKKKERRKERAKTGRAVSFVKHGLGPGLTVTANINTANDRVHQQKGTHSNTRTNLWHCQQNSGQPLLKSPKPSRRNKKGSIFHLAVKLFGTL